MTAYEAILMPFCVEIVIIKIRLCQNLYQSSLTVMRMHRRHGDGMPVNQPIAL